MNEREQAFDILTRVEREGAFASPLIETLGASTRERQFIRALVLGVLRWRSMLDEWIVQLTARPLKKLDRATVDVLRIGLFQLAFSEVEAHAAVNETVTLASRRAARAKGMVNAVLRQALRTGIRYEGLTEPATAAGIASGTAHPLWMVERWVRQYGVERAAAICQADQQHSMPDLLVNRRKTDRAAAEVLLRERGYAVRRGIFVDQVLSIDSGTAEIRDEITRGVLYPMDEGSALVASLVTREERYVWDAAAAPGGKSLVLDLLGHRVLSSDISLARLQTLRRSARAFDGVASIVVADATNAPLRSRVDAVLLDAPCSATGTIRRNPEVKWRLQEKDLAGFAMLQLQLLLEAMRVASREVVYSTCSLEPEENDAVVAAALREEPAFEIADIAVGASDETRKWIEGGVLRLTPDSGCDGFTVHKLRRKAN